MIQSPDYHTDDSCQPEFSYPPIQVAEHRGAPLVSWSGLAIIRQLVERLGVAPAIDAAVRVLRRCKWYTESDHILTMIYNMLTGGSTLSDINRFRDDQGAKRLLGTERIPHATTTDPIFLARHFWPRYYKRPISGVKVPPRASQAPSWVPSLSWPDAWVSDLSGRDHEESLHRYSHARHPAPHAGHPIHHLDNLQLL